MPTRQFVTYSEEFKVEAVRRYLEGDKGYRALAKELGIKDSKTLRSWVAKYERGESLAETRGRKTGSQRGRPRT